MTVDSDFGAVDDSFDGDIDEGQETGSPDDTPDEIEDSQTDTDEQPDETDESDEPVGEGAEGGEEGSEDQVRITLDDGEEVTLAELKHGYFRERDYTHKTTELAEERARLEQVQETFAERSHFVENTLESLTTFLESLIPPEPPVSLAQTDPGAYQYQKAMRESAISELGQLTQVRDDVAQAHQGFGQEDIARLRGEEDAKLLKAMPHLSDPAKRAAFDAKIKATAIEFGFTEDEVAGAADHRILQLVHYAELGKQAVKNRNRANAKRRVEAPKRGKARPATSTPKAGARQAKERLSKSGSFDDAMGIDFD